MKIKRHGRKSALFIAGAPIYATKLIRRMNGLSQASLVEASDGEHYVVKTWGHPGQPNLLANEYIGNSLAEAIGLPVPSCRPIYLSPIFLGKEDLGIRAAGGLYHPLPSFHYGSMFQCGDPHLGLPMEYISPRRVNSISNRVAFLGMYFLDIIANHVDDRQALFINDDQSHTIRTVFIDSGHMFGGPRWDLPPRRRAARHLECSLYHELWQSSSVRLWVNKLKDRIPGALDTALEEIPSEWFSGDVDALRASVIHRLEGLEVLIEDDVKTQSNEHGTNSNLESRLEHERHAWG